MYESLVRIHTNYYKNKVSFGISHHSSLRGWVTTFLWHWLPLPSRISGNVRQMSSWVDAAWPGAFGHSRKAADILASVACMDSSWYGWTEFLELDWHWTQIVPYGDFCTFYNALQVTSFSFSLLLSPTCSLVQYPRLKDTNFTGVTVEDCKMILATGTDTLLDLRISQCRRWSTF